MSEKKAENYWQNRDNVVVEARRVMNDYGLDALPSQKELVKLGQSELSSAIQRYHGGFSKFKKTLGE